MGFRDILCFNRALLAKQCWRLIRNLSSILAQILKARYFPRSFILSANLNYNPSYSWRNILAGREILFKGLRWSIGNGEDTNVWSSSWIPRNPGFQILSPNPTLMSNMKVAELFLSDQPLWDRRKVREFFHLSEVNHILSISIQQYCGPDCQVWCHLKDGTY